MKNYRIAYIYKDGEVLASPLRFWTLKGAAKKAERLTRATKALETGSLIERAILELVGGSREWIAIHKDELSLIKKAQEAVETAKA